MIYEMDMFFRYIDHYEPHYIEGDLSVFYPDWKERVY